MTSNTSEFPAGRVMYLQLPPMYCIAWPLKICLSVIVSACLIPLVALLLLPQDWLMLIIFVCAMPVAIMGCLLVKRQRLQQFRPAAAVPEEKELSASRVRGEHEQFIAQLARSLPLAPRRTGQLWDWEEFARRRDESGLSPAATLASQQLREELEAISRPAHLVEPEYILSSVSQSKAYWMPVTGLWCLMALISVTRRDWVSAALHGALVLILSARSRRYGIVCQA